MKTRKITASDDKKDCQLVLKKIEEEMFAKYGCLLPQHEIDVSVILPWTKESALGMLKRQDKIISWTQDNTYNEGNMRRYRIVLYADHIICI